MALQRAVLLAGLLVEVASKSSDSAGQQSQCCVDVVDTNTTCPGAGLCGPGAGTRTGAPAACGAGMEPTAAPSAEAWLARASSPPPTGAQGCLGDRVLGALAWQPLSSWGPSSSARASSSPWPASSTSSAAVSCPGSATGGTEPPPCSPAKPPR